MDKFEYELKVEQIEKLIRRNDFSTAKKISDTMDWRKEKDFRLLAKVAELYVQAGNYDQALKLLSFAYDNAPIGRLIIGRMTEVAIIAGRLDAAEEYCQEFRSVLPKDPDYYLYKFQIAEGRGGDNLAEMISCLEQYCRTELDEEWMCRLAYLYDTAGRKDDCVRMCDRIILFFCFGEYVELAMDLKQKHEPLNPYQMRRKEQKAQYEEDFRQYLAQYESDRQKETTRRQDKQQVKEEQLMEKTASQIGQQVAEIVEQEKQEKERESIAMLAESEVLFTPSIDIEEEMLRAKQEKTAQTEIEEVPEQVVITEQVATEQAEAEEAEEEQPEAEPSETEPQEAKQPAEEQSEAEQQEAEQSVEEQSEAEQQEAEQLVEEQPEEEPSEMDEEAEKADSEEDWEKLEEELIFGKKEEPEKDEVENLSEMLKNAFTKEVEESKDEEVEESGTEEEKEESEENEEESLFGALKKALSEYVQAEVNQEESAEASEAEGEEVAAEEGAEESEEELDEEGETEESEEELDEEGETEELEEELKEEETEEVEEELEEESGEEEFEEEDDYEEFEEDEGRFADEVDEAELLIPNGSFTIVSGDVEAGTQFAMELLKRISEDERGLHIARATGAYLNRTKFSLVEQQAEDGMLLVVKAGDLNDAALDGLYAWMKKDGENKLILMDSRERLEEIKKRRPKLMKRMSGTYSYVERSSEEWLRLMRLYAKENGGVMHESAQELMMEYLEDKEERQELVMLLDLKEAVQDALHQAARPTLGNLLAGILSKRYDEDGLLILKEKHFL